MRLGGAWQQRVRGSGASREAAGPPASFRQPSFPSVRAGACTARCWVIMHMYGVRGARTLSKRHVVSWPVWCAGDLLCPQFFPWFYVAVTCYVSPSLGVC